MPVSYGYEQLQPRFILGTDQWVSEVAEQMVGADLDRANQLREHFPFFDYVRGDTVLVPRVETLGTARFLSRDETATDSSATSLLEPVNEIVLARLEGTVDLSTYPQRLQSSSIDQLQLQIEFKKIAIRIAFWHQLFRKQQPGGFLGLPDLVAPTQVLNRPALTLDALDDLVASVTEADSEMDRKVIVLHPKVLTAFIRLQRATGAALQYAELSGRRYMVHNGVPIVTSEYVPADAHIEAWCMTLGLENKGVFGVVPQDVGDGGLIVEAAQNARQHDTTVYRVHWFCGVVLAQTRGLALLRVGGAA